MFSVRNSTLLGMGLTLFLFLHPLPTSANGDPNLVPQMASVYDCAHGVFSSDEIVGKASNEVVWLVGDICNEQMETLLQMFPKTDRESLRTNMRKNIAAKYQQMLEGGLSKLEKTQGS